MKEKFEASLIAQIKQLQDEIEELKQEASA